MRNAVRAGRATNAMKRKRGPSKPRVLLDRAVEASAHLPLFAAAGLCMAGFVWWFQSHYTVGLQSPVEIRFQTPIVVTERLTGDEAPEAQGDGRGKRLTGWQQYACAKFGRDCRVALAIQRAENVQGKCEVYHYNSDGSLDWGYFQINTVHLQRTDLNLRDLLDCKKNIDFAYQLFLEKGGFTPWSTFNNGRYRQFLNE